MQLSRATAMAAVMVSAGLGACSLYTGDGDDWQGEVDAADVHVDAGNVDASPADAVPADAAIDANQVPGDAPHVTPAVDIQSPLDGALVTDHNDVILHVVVSGSPIVRFDIYVDGQFATGTASTPALPFDGNCVAGCAYDIPWNADGMREGNHVVSMIVGDDLGQTATDQVTVAFQDAPEIRWVRPVANMRGARQVTAEVRLIDRGPGPITSILTIDGGAAQTRTSGDCLNGCTLTWTWDTSTASAGNHVLRVDASDANGRSSMATTSTTLGDIPYLTQIGVTGESDGLGTLEVEVHLYDAGSGQWLGCSGDGQGLANVAASDIIYNVTGWYTDSTGTPLGVEAVAGRQLVAKVWEDDLNACPTQPGSIDDLIATSPPFPASALPSLSTMFGRAIQFTTRQGRPLVR